jgi:hypothetical protein
MSTANDPPPPPADPRLALRPVVTVSYVDHALAASWPPVIGAYTYHLEVADGTGAVVYTADVDATTYAPPVALASPTFVPVAGTAYTVTVSVRGMPSEPVTATAVDLGQPSVTVTYGDGKAHLAWAVVPDAQGYVVEAMLGEVVVVTHDVDESPAPLAVADGLAVDTTYQARVRAVAGNALGPWSDPVDVTLRSVRAMLTALSARLVAGRTAGSTAGSFDYPLNATTLDDAQVLASLGAALGADLTVTAVGDPVLDTAGTSLTLTGTTAAATGAGVAST